LDYPPGTAIYMNEWSEIRFVRWLDCDRPAYIYRKLELSNNCSMGKRKELFGRCCR